MDANVGAGSLTETQVRIELRSDRIRFRLKVSKKDEDQRPEGLS